MLQQLKKHINIRALSLALFMAIVASAVFSSGKAIVRNYELQKEISALSARNTVQELENDTIRLKNEYFETDYYLELEARRLFNKASEGETVISIPESTIERFKPAPLPVKKTSGVVAEQKPFYQRNFEAWMHFLFGS